jgi:hypothetical protein
MKLATKERSKSFICDIPAHLLKRSTELSRGARNLYATMRALANGKTGELAIRGNPLDWRFIARRAEIGRDLWQRLLRELLASGYVTRERERVEHYRHGRKRIVLGRARYFVHKLPKTIRKPSILLMPDSSTVGESGTQIISETPYRGTASVVDVVSASERSEKGNQPSSSPCGHDDDSRETSVDSLTNLLLTDEDQILVRNVQARLHTQYPRAYDRNKSRVDDPAFIQEAICVVDGRGHSAISVSDAYFASGISKILDCEMDMLALSATLARKEKLRKKYMTEFSPTLTPAQEESRQKFHRMVEGKIR